MKKIDQRAIEMKIGRQIVTLQNPLPDKIKCLKLLKHKNIEWFEEWEKQIFKLKSNNFM